MADPTWPSLPTGEWQPTRDALQLWLQVVGKVRIARSPLVNHWWSSTLYVTGRGLTTSLVPGDRGRGFTIDVDLLAQRVEVQATDGAASTIPLEPQSVATFYRRMMSALDEVGLPTPIWPVPVELEGAVPFEDDVEVRPYDPEHAQRFWRLLVRVHPVLEAFRARFVGKASPVHLFWGALDLAVTRFSGRPAPPYSGTVPNCGPHVMLEAYSHEVSSCGYWPGGDGEGLFYSYAYPEPEGFRNQPAGPPEARYDATLGEFVLPYEAVRRAEHPEAVLMDFLQTTYEAAATCARWDRTSLERRG